MPPGGPTYQLLDFSVDDGIALVAFNRPDRRNAMSDEMRGEFVDALETVARDKAIKALVLTGRGSAFCAGGDIAGMKRRLESPPGKVAFNGWSRQQGVHHAVALLHGLPKPTIAAVNGAAAGLGADTALACDFVIASENAKFTWSYIKRGLIPDGGGLYFLPRRTGLSRAKELIFTGRVVEPEEAASLGIIDRRVGADELLDEAMQWARQLSSASPTALALGKTIINGTFERSAAEIFESGSKAQAICYTSTEHREAVAAFLAKSADSKRAGKV